MSDSAEKMREALVPFALVPLAYTDDIDDGAMMYPYDGGELTLGDFRRVHRALAALSASGTKSDGTAGKDADPQRNRLLGEDTPEQGAGVAPGPSDPIPSQPDEREACEEVARSFGELYALKTETGAMMFRAVTDKIADAIRARGQV